MGNIKFVYISKCFLLSILKFQIKHRKAFDDLQACDFPLKGRQFPDGLYIFKGSEMSRLYYAIIDNICYKVLNHDLVWFIHNDYRHVNRSLLNANDSWLTEKGLKMKRFAAQIYGNTGLDKLSNEISFARRVSAYKRRKEMDKIRQAKNNLQTK